MSIKPYVISGIFLFFSLLSGCAQNDSHRYSYSPGKKNPPIKRGAPVTQSRVPQSVTNKSNTREKATFHYVSKGDTLYSIAWQHGHDVRELANWNRIRWPYTIYPKQKLRVKPPKVARKSLPRISTKQTTRAQARQKTKKRHPGKSVKPVKEKTRWKKISWQWPTTGKVIGTFSARESGKKGLDIAGKKGQPIYAASGGQVVYSGDGLRGYGNLVIIKHNETYFSAYAHNHHLYVKEQQKVKKGQHIADMGSSEAQRAMLHFEVRRNGKPVDPKSYLPRRR